ncbi:hypothetical protein IMSAGC005_03839 [Lachnospiraceae bacterium]|nr:hypothetical protein IMSAGC005_03839 [Lachnospiraceae bacterium]
MDTLKICISWIIACLCQCFKSCLHQCAYTTAENCLLSKKICLCLCSESGLKYACSCAADCKGISKGFIKGFACCILINRNQTGNAFSSLIFTSYGMPRSLRRYHSDIHILRRYNLSKMNIKAVCKHQHISFFQIGFNIFLIHSSL